MNTRTPERSTPRRTSRIAVVGLAAIVAVIGFIGHQVLQSPSSPAPSPLEILRGEQRGAPGEADGVIPDGVTVSVFDDQVPAVANLDPDLLDAVRRAASDAAESGVEFHVNSGWRSAHFQQQLLQDAVSDYGSEEEAARWVATAQTSAHVSGDAIDIGPVDATSWLAQHGARYGLCQIYGNESWHYELRSAAIEQGCPEMYPDPTHDPRMWQ
ncbi:M15 family metallopeptidase [Ruania halotolerans]|uniref:M15 family metallopeptidase n=1 Tax=Ruania halotolerans TaxID=2897773 RepID=UPI001E3FD1F6|nr:M15 family metallopeptidase [Ruania halotolerans]UFU05352.1 M15 family metallopeptidase [Ruania halotolerans]